MSALRLIDPAAVYEMEFQRDVQAINLAFGKAADLVNKSISQRVEAGNLLIALRKKVEYQGHNWWDWYRKAGFVRGRKDAEKVMALANDRDPEAAAEKERTETRERVRKHRETQPEVTAYVRGGGTKAEEDDDALVSKVIALIQGMNDHQRRLLTVHIKEILPWDES